MDDHMPLVDDAPNDPVAEVPDELEDENDEGAALTAEDVQDVLLYTLDWSVESLLDRIGSAFDINPAFQRRDAWAQDRKSQYIESLMLGLPVPQVVLAEDRSVKGRFVVLDGKQRLITMKQFGRPDDKFSTFKLKKLNFLQQLNGKTFEKIKEDPENAGWVESFLSQPVRTIVVRNWQKNEVLYEVFVRLNRGSVPLNPQELRQALYPGPFSTWIDERSRTSAAIHRARRIKGEDFRMRDAEMLLRAVAFRESIESYDGDLRSFLDKTCDAGNKNWDAVQDKYKAHADAIETSIARTEEIFGASDIYFRYNRETGEYVRRFNVAVFDLMCMVLSSSELNSDVLSRFKDEISAGYKELCISNPVFEDSLKSTTKTPRATANRIILFGRLVEEITGVELPVIQRAEKLIADDLDKR
ncbi:hypothetical protein B7C42_08145 [Nocardia cerradoensis]|uniref:GmrSD restriction endonucleases N-terminal domain-containing protein n=1 Tax=Nocardia cerradoensis TaxID=85688 RepID=A0A231GT34_9NOCA|nr:DUF262 domain-containing protein [Nocardia cerradoensis]OXR39780.1 hypothetical protein B7C42_08145 [Nocardia cerradoensis]